MATSKRPPVFIETGESYPITINFANHLPKGLSVQSVVVTATLIPDGTNVTSLYIVTGSSGVSGTKVYTEIKGYQAGVRVDVKFAVTLSNGRSILPEHITVVVRDV